MIDLDYGTASLKLAYSVAGYFELKTDVAREIVQKVAKRLRHGAGQRPNLVWRRWRQTEWRRRSSMMIWWQRSGGHG